MHKWLQLATLLSRDSVTKAAGCRLASRTAKCQTLAAAFFRADFRPALGQKNKASHLDPFRKNVADCLAPLALRVHRRIEERPSNPRDHDEYQELMPMQKIQP